MVIFRSYVKLPEGITNLDSLPGEVESCGGLSRPILAQTSLDRMWQGAAMWNCDQLVLEKDGEILKGNEGFKGKIPKSTINGGFNENEQSFSFAGP